MVGWRYIQIVPSRTEWSNWSCPVYGVCHGAVWLLCPRLPPLLSYNDGGFCGASRRISWQLSHPYNRIAVSNPWWLEEKFCLWHLGFVAIEPGVEWWKTLSPSPSSQHKTLVKCSCVVHSCGVVEGHPQMSGRNRNGWLRHGGMNGTQSSNLRLLAEHEDESILERSWFASELVHNGSCYVAGSEKQDCCFQLSVLCPIKGGFFHPHALRCRVDSGYRSHSLHRWICF